MSQIEPLESQAPNPLEDGIPFATKLQELAEERPDNAAVTVVAGANLTTQILKVALAHPRFQSVLGHDQLGPVAFPSGHTTAAASIAIAFLFVVPHAWRPAVAAIAGHVAFYPNKAEITVVGV